MSYLDDEELEATRKFIQKNNLQGGIQMKDYEYERTKSILKKRFISIKEDPSLSLEDKTKAMNSLTRQMAAIKKEFTKQLPPKEHYSRAKKKAEEVDDIQHYVDR